jgi:hypothetical protein
MAQLIEQLANDLKFEGLTTTVTENIGKRKEEEEVLIEYGKQK